MSNIDKQQEELENLLNDQHEGVPVAFNKNLPKIVMPPPPQFEMDKLPDQKQDRKNVVVKSHDIRKPKEEKKPKTPDLF